jgi:hypothetical protein
LTPACHLVESEGRDLLDLLAAREVQDPERDPRLLAAAGAERHRALARFGSPWPELDRVQWGAASRTNLAEHLDSKPSTRYTGAVAERECAMARVDRLAERVGQTCSVAREATVPGHVRRFAVTGVFALAVAGAPTGVVTAGSGVPIDQALAFRSEFGLSTDVSRVQALEADKAANRDYGVALSDAERTEMRRRERISDRVGPLSDYLDRRADINGGIYLDQKHRGRIVVQLVAASEADRAEIRELAPADSEIAFEDVPTRLDDLTTAYESVNALLPEFRAAGIHINEVGIDIPTSSLRFGLARLDAGWLETISAAMDFGALEFSESGRVEPAACSQYSCLAPNDLRAGLRIWRTIQGQGTFYCTSGFLVRARQSPSNTLMLTAGHCFNNAPEGANVYHGTPGGTYEALGAIGATAYWDGSNADAMIIDISNSRESNLKYLSVAINRTGVTSVGAPVCMTGQATLGTKCGQVLSYPVTTLYPDGTRFISQVKTSIPIKLGDSGGPVYHGSSSTWYAFGLTVARDSDTVSYYTRMDIIKNTLNVDLCIDAACVN